jgi:MFS family permease
LALTGVVELWMVWILALGLGITRAFDTPTRQAFVSELVEGPALARAIGINSTVVSAARMIGPAAGGVIIALFGVGECFIINAASFAGPLIGLLAMDTTKLYRPDVRAARTPHAVRAGLRYVKRRRDLLIPLLMMAIIGTLAYEFQVTIPLMAHSAFHLGAAGFGLLYAAMGAGAVVSGVTLAGKVPGRVRTLVISAAALGVALGATALAPGPASAAIALGFAGAASVVYSSSTNGTLQLRADPSMRGRVVALYVMAFMGSTAIGGPLVGAVGQVVGPRASLWVGALGCGAAVLLALGLGQRERRRSEAPPARASARAAAAR